MSSPTYGERLVQQLLNKLPKEQFFTFNEVRIISAGKEYADFVVVGSRIGVIVIEVKDWVEIIEATPKTVRIQRRSGERVTEDNPILTAREYATNLASKFQKRSELLLERDGRPKLIFPWMSAVILPNISRTHIDFFASRDIWANGEVLSKEDLIEAEFLPALNRIPRKWNMKEPLNTTILDVIRGVINPRVVLTDASGSDIGTLTYSQEKLIGEKVDIDAILDNEVENLAHNSTVRLVRGVAGSGKSLVLAKRAEYLSKEYPERNILVVAFNKDLVTDLSSRISRNSNTSILHFHKLCSNILQSKWSSPLSTESWIENSYQKELQSIGLTPRFVSDEIEWRKELKISSPDDYLAVPREGRGVALQLAKRMAINQIYDAYNNHLKATKKMDWADVPFKVLNELKIGTPYYQKYDFVLIDEAQDFAPSWIEIIKRIVKNGGLLFLCDDPTQSLFRSFSWKQKGVDVVGRTRILRVPFRCTKQISRAAYALVESDPILRDSSDTSLPDLTTYELRIGEPPVLCSFTREDREIFGVEGEATRLAEKYGANNIAILLHNRRLVKHWASLRDKGFYVESFDKMKGLEFQAVIIPWLHDIFSEAENTGDEELLAQSKKRLFTAMTRAREYLVLTYHNRLPNSLEPIYQYTTSKKG